VGSTAREGSLRGRVDRTLPPFTTRRYVAIWILGLIPLVFVLLVLTQCNNQGGGAASGGEKYMVIETAKGRITAKLHTQSDAGVSKTIANFETKANSGYFNNLTFHRVENWVIQGGDPAGNGTGGGDMTAEYNQLPFTAGALGVARGGDKAINNDSQFFIVKSDASNLNGEYTNFGQVTEGMDVVNQIAIGDKINKVTVENR
jgi:peptidyl-prolyl cis-trans isomerase B (cyclophilin B)